MASKKVSLQHNQTPRLETELRINYITDALVKSAWTRYDVVQYCKDTYGLSETQGEKYYTAAVKNILPKNPEAYRETLIARNMATLENMLKKCLDRENFKQANEVIKTINSMLGVGGKQVEIKDKDNKGDERTIKISFSD